MKIIMSLFAMILLMSASSVGLAAPLTPEQVAQIKALKECTPQNEQDLRDILDITKKPQCWQTVPDDPVKKTKGYTYAFVNTLDFDVQEDPFLLKMKPSTIVIKKPVVLPDHVSFVPYPAMFSQDLSSLKPMQFIFDLDLETTKDKDGKEIKKVPHCAITVSNNDSFGLVVETAGVPANLTIIPGIPTEKGAFLHKDTAVCITGNDNIIYGLTIDKNDSSGFVNGIVIDGQNNGMGATITTMSTGVTINGLSNRVLLTTIETGFAGIIVNSGGKPNVEPNLIGSNTIQTSDGCLKDSKGKCSAYSLNAGGLILNAKDNLVGGNTLKANTPIVFGYDSKYTPAMPMEAAANLLKLNNLSKDDATVSNYQELYLGMLGQKDLPKCLGDVKYGNVSYTYIYIPTMNPKTGQKESIVSCADGSNVNPACPTVNKLTGKCACADAVCSDKSCPAGTTLSDGNICVPPTPSKGGSANCPSNIFDTTGKCVPKDQNKALCGAGNYILLGGKCGTSCGKNQHGLNGKCECTDKSFIPDPSDPINCILNPNLNGEVPAQGGGGGDCSLTSTTTAASPVAAFLIVIALTGLSAMRLRPKAVRIKSQRRPHG